MKKTLVIGDIHNKYYIVDRFLTKLNYQFIEENEDKQIIFVGDYFDDFHDDSADAKAMALWLKDSLTKPNRIHLMGNHDYHYMIKPKGSAYCSGFSSEKYDAINEILTDEDWQKIKYFHSENNYWFSHAGIARYWFEHPLLGVTEETITTAIQKAFYALKARKFEDVECIYGADYFRGGPHPKGGLLWNDWRNSEFYDGITQIFGHTPHRNIKVSVGENNAKNINIDTHLAEILEIDGQGIKIINRFKTKI